MQKSIALLDRLCLELHRVSFHHHLVETHLDGCVYGMQHCQRLRMKGIWVSLQISCLSCYYHTTIFLITKPQHLEFDSFREAPLVLIFNISGGGLDHLSFLGVHVFSLLALPLKIAYKDSQRNNKFHEKVWLHFPHLLYYSHAINAKGAGMI